MNELEHEGVNLIMRSVTSASVSAQSLFYSYRASSISVQKHVLSVKLMFVIVRGFPAKHSVFKDDVGEFVFTYVLFSTCD